MKKGYTLVELIAVVALLALIFLVAVPNVMNTLTKVNEEKYNRYLNDVFLATEAFLEANLDDYIDFINTKQTIYISYNELLSSRYLKSTVYDSKNEKTVKDEDFTVEVYFLEDSDEYHYKLHERHIPNGFVIQLENAKFGDGTTVKTFERGDEVEIFADMPNDYVEDSFSGDTSCSSSGDIDNVEYKVKHEYSVKKWNVSNSTDNSIVYRVNSNKTIILTYQDTTSEVEKHKCTETDGTYHASYYTCDSGGSLSGARCSYASNYGASTRNYACWGQSCGCGDCECTCQEKYCPSGGSLSGNTCYRTITYNATYHDEFYTCPEGYLLVDSKCYNMESIN